MARPEARIDEILEELGKVWHRYPDMRLGQLLVNLIRPSDPVPAVFSFEDGKLLRRLKRYPRPWETEHESS